MRVITLVGTLVLMASSLDACQVPVFRYALERWVSDSYQVSVLHRGDLSDDEAMALTQLLEATGDEAYNLDLVGVFNFAAMTEAETWTLEPGDLGLPQIQVRYPLGAKATKLLWQSPLTSANVAQLLDSPVRDVVRSHLTDGASAVWLLVESGNEEQDANALQTLQESLEDLQGRLTLPDGVIGNEAFSAGAVDPSAPGFEMDNVLRSTIPLQIQFPIVRLPADDPAEGFFRRMLLGAAPYLQGKQTEPVAVPVFGRGRMMHGLPASRLSQDTLESACSYLCGACSCQVKEQNPGIDLLMHARWDDLLQGQLMIMERALPPLAGVGDLQPAEQSVVLATTTSPPSGGKALQSSVLLALGGVLVLIVGATGILIYRTHRS